MVFSVHCVHCNLTEGLKRTQRESLNEIWTELTTGFSLFLSFTLAPSAPSFLRVSSLQCTIYSIRFGSNNFFLLLLVISCNKWTNEECKAHRQMQFRSICSSNREVDMCVWLCASNTYNSLSSNVSLILLHTSFGCRNFLFATLFIHLPLELVSARPATSANRRMHRYAQRI